MGNQSSSPRGEGNGRPSSTGRSISSSGWHHDHAQSSYSSYAQNYPVQNPYPAGYPPSGQEHVPPQNYGTSSQSHVPPQIYGSLAESHAPPPQHGLSSQLHMPQKKFDRRYSRIVDSYRSLEEVTESLAHAGLESSNLIVGIYFTKSNEWTGKNSYNGRSLHYIGNGLNPYEQAISIIGKTMATFDDDNLISCFGFGDASTHDQDVFSFYPE